MKIEDLKSVIDDLIYEAIVGKKNPFQVGDLVKLRPDVLGRHSKSIPAHAGFTTEQFSWRDTLRKLSSKMGKITRVFPNSEMVNVEYEDSWVSKDTYGRSYTVNTIGIDYTELVPYATDPNLEEGVEEGVGYVYDKDMRKDPKHIKGKRWTVKYESEKDLDDISKSVVNENSNNLYCPRCGGILKYVADISSPGSGQAWNCTQCEGSFVKMGNTIIDPKEIDQTEPPPWELDPSDVQENQIRNIIQELIKEMWVGFEEEKEPVKEGDFYHPNADNGSPEIPGTVKLSMMGQRKPAAVTIPPSTAPIIQQKNSVPVISPEKRARLLAMLKQKTEEVKKKVTETRESNDKNYIIFGRIGAGVAYYVDSSTQGERMIQFGRDMAYRFKTLEQVRNKIIKLKLKYKGITDWDYEIVRNPSTADIPMPQSLPKSPNRKGHTVSKPVKKGDEYFIRYAIDGKTDEGKSYYTDDKEDALATYAHMLKYADEENKKPS